MSVQAAIDRLDQGIRAVDGHIDALLQQPEIRSGGPLRPAVTAAIDAMHSIKTALRDLRNDWPRLVREDPTRARARLASTMGSCRALLESMTRTRVDGDAAPCFNGQSTEQSAPQCAEASMPGAEQRASRGPTNNPKGEG